MPDVQRNDEFWENLGITFSVPSEADFDEILDFYLREFVPGSYIHVFFKKNGSSPASFCLFLSFQPNITIFTTNGSEKMAF